MTQAEGDDREAYRRKKSERNKQYKERWSHPGLKGWLIVRHNRPQEGEAERLMAQIPPDTRTPSQALMGDPLPGRSALDQRRAEQGGNVILLRLERSDSCALPETDGLK